MAYLLRLWLSDNAGQPVWRGSLEDPHSGAYLNQQTELPPSTSDDRQA